MSSPRAILSKQGEISVTQDEDSELWRWEFFPFIGGGHISPSFGDFEHKWPDEALDEGIQQVLEWFPEEADNLQRWDS